MMLCILVFLFNIVIFYPLHRVLLLYFTPRWTLSFIVLCLCLIHSLKAKLIHLLLYSSSGVGRSGTFIGLDALVQQGRRTGHVDVPVYVDKMRRNRMCMVQTDVRHTHFYPNTLYVTS